jgi:hypothetical protein
MRFYDFQIFKKQDPDMMLWFQKTGTKDSKTSKLKKTRNQRWYYDFKRPELESLRFPKFQKTGTGDSKISKKFHQKTNSNNKGTGGY